MEKYNNDEQLDAFFHPHKQPENDNLFNSLDDLDTRAWGTPLENKDSWNPLSDPWGASLGTPLTLEVALHELVKG